MAAAPAMPESVKVGTITYQVTQDPDEWLRIEHSTQTNGFYGHTEHKQATIYINPAGTDDVTRLTLWHEVLHAVTESMMGQPAFDHLGKTKRDREETIVGLIESPTLTILRDNPQLVAYLTA